MRTKTSLAAQLVAQIMRNEYQLHKEMAVKHESRHVIHERSSFIDHITLIVLLKLYV